MITSNGNLFGCHTSSRSTRRGLQYLLIALACSYNACSDDSSPVKDASTNDMRIAGNQDQGTQNDGPGGSDATPDGSNDSQGSGCGGSATYEVTFNAAWSATSHPTDFPSNPHFSGLIGATRNQSFEMWETGDSASPGMKSMAETGSKDPLNSEIDQAIAQGNAGVKISGNGVNPSPGSVSITFNATSAHTLVSLVSMIAPSPDWFVGVHDFNLCVNGQWITSETVELFAYDAGTDSGTTFTSANQATNPAQPIANIHSQAPFNGTPALGTFVFTKQ